MNITISESFTPVVTVPLGLTATAVATTLRPEVAATEIIAIPGPPGTPGPPGPPGVGVVVSDTAPVNPPVGTIWVTP